MEKESTEIMASSDVDLINNTYGASLVSLEQGENGYLDNSDEGLSYNMFGPKNVGTDLFPYEIFFPKTNFSLYSTVTISSEIRGNSQYYCFYAMTENNLIDVKGDSDATITVKRNGNTYTATISVAGFGSDSITLTDQNIISGQESLPIYCVCLGVEIFNEFVITNVTLKI